MVLEGGEEQDAQERGVFLNAAEDLPGQAPEHRSVVAPLCGGRQERHQLGRPHLAIDDGLVERFLAGEVAIERIGAISG